MLEGSCGGIGGGLGGAASVGMKPLASAGGAGVDFCLAALLVPLGTAVCVRSVVKSMEGCVDSGAPYHKLVRAEVEGGKLCLG